jgi:hypothetical protein
MTAARFERYTRLMLAGAAAILIATAVLHGFGFTRVDSLLSHAEMPETWRDAVRMVWIIYAAHLLLIAAMLAYAAGRSHAVPGALLMICGLIPAIDALLMLIYVGDFIGSLLLGLAAVLVFGAVARGTMHWHDGQVESLRPR